MQVVDATALRKFTLWFLATTAGRYDLLLKLIIRKLSAGYAIMKGRWQRIANYDSGATRCVTTKQILSIVVALELRLHGLWSCYSNHCEKQSVIIVNRHDECTYRLARRLD